MRDEWKRNLGIVASLSSVVLVASALAACGEWGADDEEGLGDAPVEQQEDVPVRVYPSPNLFSNLAARCIGPNGVYWTTAEVPVSVVVNDPNCEPGGLLYDGEPNGD